MQNVIMLGLVSFFSDISSEMVYPLIPLYLTAAFGATPALVGVIEGIAESVASLLKVFSGYLSDRYQRKKPLAFVGYATGLVYKVALVLSTSWMGILAARVVDRIGKGIRTAPRDVLVSESAESGSAGKSFGIHKALDMAGSAVGILMAFFIVRASGGNMDYKNLFIISAIPAIIGLLLLLFVKENPAVHKIEKREPFWKNVKGLNFNLKLYLAVTFIFTLGNSSNTFLLLKAKSVGFDDANVVFLYFLYNITASLLAVPFGKLSDKIGRKRVLVVGYFTFALVYFGFALVTKPLGMIFIFVLYGFYTAMTAGVERAFIAEIAPPQLKGTMLGLQSTIVGVALLPASVIAGRLWDSFGAGVPFVFGGSLAIAACLILAFGLKTEREK